MTRHAVAAFLFALITTASFAQSATHRLDAPVFDYAVSELEHSGGYTMVRGFFDQGGTYSGSVVITDPITGAEDLSWPVFAGEIHAIVTDGVGGFYVAGNIQSVDDEDLGNLVHVRSDKTVDRAWLPNPFGTVFDMKLDNGILYIGGTFVNVGGQSRYYAAAFDLATGALTSWNPHLDNRVTCIHVTNDAVFLAGMFTKVNNGATTRNKIAAVNKTGGEVIAGWDLDLNGTTWSVNALAASASTLYVGGSFSTADGISRNGLVAVSTNDGSVNAAWDPQPMDTGSPIINTLVLDGTTLYVGGRFNSGIGGDNTLLHLAALSTGTGAPAPGFHPQFDFFDEIDGVHRSGSQLYIYGSFNSVSGITRIRLAALSTVDGAPSSWTANLQGGIHALAEVAGKMVLAGDLNGINWQNYDGLALLNEATNTFWPHAITLPLGEDINAFKVSGNTLFIGGSFTSVNGVSRKNLAAIDLTNGSVLPWNPGASGTTNTSFDDTRVNAIEIKDGNVYVAGIFLTAGGQPRRGLAALDAVTGAATPWNPSVGDGSSMDEFIRSMELRDNRLFVAGTFTTLAGSSRAYAGAVNTDDGTLVNWHPDVPDEVRKIRLSDNAAFILGDFSAGIGGSPRPHGVAAIDLVTGEPTSFNPAFNSSAIADFALSETDVYIGGYFSTADGEPRPGLASYSLATGALNAWDPDLGSAKEGNYDVAALAVSASRLYVGGGFIWAGNQSRISFAEYNLGNCAAVANITLDGATLYASPGDAYQWFENGVAVSGATTQSFPISFFEYGRFAVEVTVDGCSARSADYVYLVTGKDPVAESNIRFYPNPVQRELFIDVPSRATVTVYDASGRAVFSKFLSDGAANIISVEDWSKGVYLARVQAGKTTKTFTIIKTH